jgi:hypothetical protein
MQLKDWLPIIISAISLLMSVVTVYKTFLARFSGKAWPAKRMVITHIEGIPSIGIACFFTNSGAKPGRLDHLRLRVKHRESASEQVFFPILVRADYNIFASYKGNEWFPFSGMWLDPGTQARKYILFRPLNDIFQAQAGHYEVSLEIHWDNEKNWTSFSSAMSYEITDRIATQWNDPKADAIQVSSKQVLESQWI